MKTLLTEPHTNVVRLLGCCTSANDKGETILNKTKYFRLHLTDEIRSERPKGDQRPETDLRLT